MHPWNRVLEKLVVYQMTTKFPAFCASRRFSTVVTGNSLYLSWARWIHSFPFLCNSFYSCHHLFLPFNRSEWEGQRSFVQVSSLGIARVVWGWYFWHCGVGVVDSRINLQELCAGCYSALKMPWRGAVFKSQEFSSPGRVHAQWVLKGGADTCDVITYIVVASLLWHPSRLDVSCRSTNCRVKLHHAL